jgi:hypothetical protein
MMMMMMMVIPIVTIISSSLQCQGGGGDAISSDTVLPLYSFVGLIAKLCSYRYVPKVLPSISASGRALQWIYPSSRFLSQRRFFITCHRHVRRRRLALAQHIALRYAIISIQRAPDSRATFVPTKGSIPGPIESLEQLQVVTLNSSHNPNRRGCSWPNARKTVCTLSDRGGWSNSVRSAARLYVLRHGLAPRY